ncbi:cytochrome P450 [Mycena epipterygia]|nr:cytochrome P450 [Mycena epipterygia]
MSSILPLVFIGVTSVIILARCFWISLAPLAGVPYSKFSRWNPLGDIPGLVGASTPVDFFSQHVLKHGAISQVLLGPLGRLILVADANEIEENLGKKSYNFDKAESVRAAFVGTLREGSVGLPANEKWKLHRRMMAPSMSPAYLGAKMSQLCANVQKLMEIWLLKSQLALKFNGVFECDDDIERFAMDIIMVVLFGENLGCLQSTFDHLMTLENTASMRARGILKVNAPSPPVYQNLRYLLKGMGSALRSGAAKLMYLRLNLSPAWRSARSESYRFLDNKLGEHPDHAGGHDSFLDRLSARYPGGRHEGVSLSAFKDELMTYIMYGADTSATVIAWIIKYLTLYPRVQLRLHAELSASFQISDSFSISYEELTGTRFPYLDAVVYETLRLANVGGVSARDALHNVTISGCHIPKGSQVFFLTGHWGINNAPPVKGNSEIKSSDFYPERWLEQGPNGTTIFSAASVTSWPFGYGPRGCPGQRLALLELKAFLLGFNSYFFLEETSEATDPQAEMLVVLRKPSQMGIKLRKWNDVHGEE